MTTARTSLAARFGAMPRDLVAISLVTLGFSVIVAILAHVLGTRFVLPQGDSPVTGASALAPFVLTIGIYLGLQGLAFLAAADSGHTTSWRMRVLLDLFMIALFTAVVYVHFHLKMWVPLVNDRSFDAAFYAVDEALRAGIEALRIVRAGLADFLPEADHWYHPVYFALFALAFFSHAIGSRAWHYHNMLALVIVEALGALSYLIAPAVGPFLFEVGDNGPATEIQRQMLGLYSAMREGGVAWVDAHGAQYLTAPLAAMPSLHLAGVIVLAYYAIRARLVVAPVIVFTSTWVAIEAIVTRWHYVVDLPAGAALAAVSIVAANRICAFRVRDAKQARSRREERAAADLRARAAARAMADVKRRGV